MSKVGLKDTLALIAKGYSKKEIDALAAIDEEQISPATENTSEAPAPVEDKKAPVEDKKAPVEDKKAPDDAADKESNQEPDYKTMYEDLLKKNQANEDKLKKLQQDNINKNSAPAAAEAKQKEAESLTNLVRGFM